MNFVFMTDAEWAAFAALTRPDERPPRVLVFGDGETS